MQEVEHRQDGWTKVAELPSVHAIHKLLRNIREHMLGRVLRETGVLRLGERAGEPRGRGAGARGLWSRGRSCLPCVLEAYLEVECANRHDVRTTTMLQQTCTVAARALQPAWTDCNCCWVMYQRAFACLLFSALPGPEKHNTSYSNA